LRDCSKKASSPEFEPWRQQTIRVIKRIFGDKSGHAEQFERISYGLQIWTTGTPESAWQEAFESGLAEAQASLKSFLDELEMFPRSGSLSCPKCNSTDVRFLEIDETGSRKYTLAIPQIAGVELKSGKKVAYHQCNSCKIVFYAEPFKT